MTAKQPTAPAVVTGDTGARAAPAEADGSTDRRDGAFMASPAHYSATASTRDVPVVRHGGDAARHRGRCATRSRARDDAFLVSSGDALTDIDLGALVSPTARPARSSRLPTRVPDPRSSASSPARGRATTVPEKTTWGQVFSTRHTGIYVMERRSRARRAGVRSMVRTTSSRSGRDGRAAVRARRGGLGEDGAHRSTFGRRPTSCAEGGRRDRRRFEVAQGIWIGMGPTSTPTQAPRPAPHRRTPGRGAARPSARCACSATRGC